MAELEVCTRQAKSVSLALLRWPMHVTRMLCFHRVIQWSFGITCWEIFSGGKTPYPGVDPLSLVQLLENGRRLEKPLNAACSDTMYVLSVYHCKNRFVVLTAGWLPWLYGLFWYQRLIVYDNSLLVVSLHSSF